MGTGTNDVGLCEPTILSLLDSVMPVTVLDEFPSECMEYLLSLPEVLSAKEQMDKKSQGSFYFTIPVTSAIRAYLSDVMGLQLTELSCLPMRWIKGDTLAHVDKGPATFEQTYLLYLTDSPGALMVEGGSYPIRKGCGYTFSEGLSHGTVGTGMEPRLLMGPMSELGVAVGGGTIFGDGATDTIYVSYNSGLNQNEYQINNSVSQPLFLPIVIQNTNLDPANNVLKIIFTTNIILVNSADYFICGSDGLQFGSTSLNNDGSRPHITIDNVIGYNGFIQNTGNYSYNYIFNLEVRAINSTLTDNSGWIGQPFFGSEATNNYIVNCFSDGDIPLNGGGIVGQYAGRGDGTNPGSSSLYIIGCSSQGNVGVSGGGIIGEFAGEGGGYVKCEQCWQEFGTIGPYAGGIFGKEAANGDVIGGEAIALKCYSRGQITGIFAGGIFGQLAGTNATTLADRCYNQSIMTGPDCGGIYGGGAGSDGGTSIATNCYSSELEETSGYGIFSGGVATGRIATNCYAANANWTNIAANLSLDGIPSPVVGTSWVYTGIDYPYELNAMGYTPYTLENIVVTGGVASLLQFYGQTISAGGSTLAAVRPGYSYDILQITGGDPGSYSTITSDASSGVISTLGSTAPGTYNLVMRNTGSYNITIFGLAIAGGGGLEVETVSIPPCCQPICPQYNQTTNNTQQQLSVKESAIAIASDVDSTYLAINQNRGVQFLQPAFKSYRDYMLYLQSKYR